MNNIEKYPVRAVDRGISDFYDDDQSRRTPMLDVLAALTRQWRLVLATFLVVCLFGIPAVWKVVKPYYKATAAIRVTPVISSILFNGDNSIPMYKSFVHTQADLIVSDTVLQKVAEELAETNILNAEQPKRSAGTHKGKPMKRDDADPVAALRDIVTSGTLRVEPEDNTELIKITMKSSEPHRAAAIVNAFLKAYMAIVAGEESASEDGRIAVLENERRTLAEKLQRQRKAVSEITKEYGAGSLTSRQEMKLERVAALQNKITEFEMQKIALKLKEQLLEDGQEVRIGPHELVRLRYDFINADLMVKALTMNAAELEQELMVARQQLAATNPELGRKAELVAALRERLDRRRDEVGGNFDDMVAGEMAKKDTDNKVSVNAQLQQINSYQEHLQEMLSAEDATVVALGRKQLAIEDLQRQFDMTKELYDTVQRRIQEIEVERKRPARISKAYFANTAPFEDKREKYTIALMFAAVSLGAMLAVVRQRLDVRVHTPNDVAKATGIRVIGTTTRPTDIEEAFLTEHFINDYQTICANLGLLHGQGIPRKLSITSPRPKDGKTTLAINLSLSLAKMGRKVLLIDGDLRKADVAYLMKLRGGTNALKHVLLGRDPQDFVCHTSVEGLDLLPSNPCEPSTIYNLLAPERVEGLLDHLSTEYDHIIVDTPPVLDVPDALLWARAVDAVVLTAYSGHTKSTDIRESLARLAQMDATVMGTVLNNVAVRQSYNAYHYYADATMTHAPHLNSGRRMNLLPMGNQGN